MKKRSLSLVGVVPWIAGAVLAVVYLPLLLPAAFEIPREMEQQVLNAQMDQLDIQDARDETVVAQEALPGSVTAKVATYRACQGITQIGLSRQQPADLQSFYVQRGCAAVLSSPYPGPSPTPQLCMWQGAPCPTPRPPIPTPATP